MAVTIPLTPSDNEPINRATYGAGSAGFTPATSVLTGSPRRR
jgi:hypothetical protein